MDWIAVRGLVLNTIYGAKIDVASDMEIMTSLVNSCFSADLIPVNGRAPVRRLCKYLTVPINGSKTDYLELIKTLPTTDELRLLDLEPHIDARIQTAKGETFINGMRKILSV